MKDEKKYHQRSKTETVFGMVKKMFGKEDVWRSGES